MKLLTIVLISIILFNCSQDPKIIPTPKIYKISNGEYSALFTGKKIHTNKQGYRDTHSFVITARYLLDNNSFKYIAPQCPCTTGLITDGKYFCDFQILTHKDSTFIIDKCRGKYIIRELHEKGDSLTFSFTREINAYVTYSGIENARQNIPTSSDINNYSKIDTIMVNEETSCNMFKYK